MTLLRPKQIKFTTENQLIVGSSTGNGKALNPGATDTFLKMTPTGLAYAPVDVIRDEANNNSITATATAIELKTTADGLTSTLSVEPSETGMSLTVTGDEGVRDLLLVPADGGNVVIGGPGDGVIEAEAGEDLSIKGGEGAGNLFISAGATGKVYYGADASNPLNEIATLGTVRGDLSSSFQRVQYQGNAEVVVPANAVSNTVEVYINGVLVDVNDYTISNNIVSFSEEDIGFTLDIEDIIVLTYMGIA